MPGQSKGRLLWPMDRKKVDALSFEDGYNRLEGVIRRLEEGELSLDESVALYEEGMKLAEHCGRQLDDAELKVTQILSEVADRIDTESQAAEG